MCEVYCLLTDNMRNGVYNLNKEIVENPVDPAGGCGSLVCT